MFACVGDLSGSLFFVLSLNKVLADEVMAVDMNK